MMWNKFIEKPSLPAPYDGKTFLAKLEDNTVVPAVYKLEDYSEYYNFYHMNDEGDLLYLYDQIIEWKPIS